METLARMQLPFLTWALWQAPTEGGACDAGRVSLPGKVIHHISTTPLPSTCIGLIALESREWSQVRVNDYESFCIIHSGGYLISISTSRNLVCYSRSCHRDFLWDVLYNNSLLLVDPKANNHKHHYWLSNNWYICDHALNLKDTVCSRRENASYLPLGFPQYTMYRLSKHRELNHKGSCISCVKTWKEIISIGD